MKIPSFFVMPSLAAVLGVVGCSSPAREAADIHPGDTPENVVAAVGRPDRQLQRPGTVPETVWIYANLNPRPPVATGWRQVLVPGVSDQNGKVIQQPVTRDVYRREEKPDMHVVFTNGRVKHVEYSGK